MYHVVMGVAADDSQLEDKVGFVADLPGATDSVRVTLVHVYDGEDAVESVPAVATALDLLDEAGIEAEATGAAGEDPSQGLLDAAAKLDADLLCIGGRRRSPAGKLQMRAGAQRVTLRAECPVVIAGDVESREPRT